MEIRQLIDKNIHPLADTQTVREALLAFENQKYDILPVIDQYQNYIGLLRKEDILSREASLTLNSNTKLLHTANSDVIHVDEHFYELISKLYELNSPIVPVVDKDETFLGVVTTERLMYMFSASFSFVEPGSILTLYIPRTDYSLAEIAQIVESEGGAILSSIIHNSEVPEAVYVTLKINLNNLSSIIQSFERHGYKVKSRFSEREYQDVLKDRYDELMNFLNV